MATAAVSSATASSTSAYGLDFQSLLKIILTQLTYQDPLKPVDNFEFVSQLAQFSQLQQSQTLNDQITSLIATQSATQATGLLGRTVDFTSGQSTLSGVVQAIALSSGTPAITIKTADGQSLSGIAISDITQVR
ncbi:MAG: flagellar hook capping FlgD N-terminal domain-containing protein [Caulobacteraceae bacterium]|nr:flagellar hook capping FlgD N-terminal domain-containing protein [Caulobacteraceae bacterium]